MNNAIIPQTKRRPGRPRKTVNISSFNKLTTYTPQRGAFAPKRRAATEDGAGDDIEIVGYNGFENSHAKKPKADDLQPKRSQPPRRARFTESYGGTAADVVVISDEEQDEESESEDSDSDCGPIPSPVMKVRSQEEQALWEENVQNLKKALSDEEMKLVLLRKLQESQKTKDPKREAASSPAPVPANPLKASSSITLKGGVQIQPLPSKQLLTNNKYLSAKKDVKPEIHQPTSSRTFPKSSSSSSFKPIQPPAKPTSNSPIALTVPKSVEPLNSNHLNQYPLLKNLSNQITITAVPPSTPSASSKNEERMDSETLQQRQAAAKLALRKQLEKTLLQIPLPKPPPLKINFFPNASSIEFLCLLGLDFVVDCLTKSKKNNSQTNKVPLTCAQCSTDFTCTWKWKEVDKNGKKAYDAYCEACITSNIRKALKAQHTNNLKSAFLKALQQEKEIDRLSLAAVPTKSHSATSRESSSSSRQRVPAPAHQVNTSSSYSLPKVSASVPYIPKAPSQGLNHAALAQLSKLSPQYQSLFHAQVQAQQLLAGVPLHPSVLSLTPFMTQGVTPNHHGRQGRASPSQNDSRRQRYRSDRVQSPSIPQASSSWKA